MKIKLTEKFDTQREERYFVLQGEHGSHQEFTSAGNLITLLESLTCITAHNKGYKINVEIEFTNENPKTQNGIEPFCV